MYHEDDPWRLMPSTGGYTVTTEQSLAVSVVTFSCSVLFLGSRGGGNEVLTSLLSHYEVSILRAHRIPWVRVRNSGVSSGGAEEGGPSDKLA